MGVLGRLAERVEAMVPPALTIAEELVRATAEVTSAGLRFVDRELHYLGRELKRRGRRPGGRERR